MSFQIEHLENIAAELRAAIAAATDAASIERIRIEYFGRKDGVITRLMHMITNLSLEEKRTYAPHIQKLQRDSEIALAIRLAEIQSAHELEALKKERARFDVTAYRTEPFIGALHPYTQIIQRIEDIFISLGYSLAIGSEIEDEWHNFEA